MRKCAIAIILAVAATPLPVAAQDAAPDPAAPDPHVLIDDAVIADVRDFLETEIVRLSVTNQNERHADIDDDDIQMLDRQWRTERETADMPLIAATLSSPLSVFLTRVQAQALGLYVEIFVTDDKGLNVGQSAITSDYWQGDEAKFQKTFPVGPDAVFIDAAEWDDAQKIWRAQLNLTVTDATGARPLGATTIEINLTELMRRKAAIAS
ncbi:hypothetical protein [Saliniramus sp.]|uniref:hypothetical protein n=1 Tax=Saliniramus sp. TaxID=2986772 RepID=UPI002C807046|nr:hypothetical protein [Saliniramus sp.]HMB11620.1 hypothetical protein [Saliniramus sp.]